MKICNRLYNLPRHVRDSIKSTLFFIGFIATVASVLGHSLKDLVPNFYCGILVLIITLVLMFAICYLVILFIFRKSVDIQIRNTSVKICYGDIFSKDDFSGQVLRIIGCDSHFNTQVDDKVISKKSLHGQLVLKHGDEKEIKKAVREKAKQLQLEKNIDGLYDFPLGTIISYNSSKEGLTYLMLAMTELNDRYEAHSDMAKFVSMLMNMWREISSVHAGYDIAIPLLGSGILRFDDGPRSNDELLRCLLCSLDNSGVTLKSQVYIVIYDNTHNKVVANLYDYKDVLRTIPRK